MTTDVQQATSLMNKIRMTYTKSEINKKREMHHFLVNGHRFDVDTYYKPNIAVGSGAYGVVCSAVDARYKKKVAIKKCANAFEDIIDGKRILREIKLLQHFDHENITKLEDIIPPPKITSTSGNLRNFNDVYIVLEYMESDLHKIIYSKNKLTEEHFQYFIFQLLLGLKYMNSCGIIHRDLKPSNLLVNGNCKLKICDFGLSRGLDWNNELTEYVVTRWYRAPEIMYTCQEYDEKVDMWSVGTILAEMIRRKPLFAGDHYIQQLNLIFELIGTPKPRDLKCITNAKALKYIQKLQKKVPIPFYQYFRGASKECISLLEKMLVFNPEKRISVEDALAHPYFAKLYNKELMKKSVCKKPTMDSSFEMKCKDRRGLKEQMLEACLEERVKSNCKWEQARTQTKET